MLGIQNFRCYLKRVYWNAAEDVGDFAVRVRVLVSSSLWYLTRVSIATEYRKYLLSVVDKNEIHIFSFSLFFFFFKLMGTGNQSSWIIFDFIRSLS